MHAFLANEDDVRCAPSSFITGSDALARGCKLANFFSPNTGTVTVA
jgi:hypothetical protein